MAPVTVAITVTDGDCEEDRCRESFTVDCATTKDRVSADALAVSAADFSRVYRELGCEE